MEYAIAYGLPLTLLLVGVISGRIVEKKHFAQLALREAETQNVVVLNLKRVAFDRPVLESRLVSGNVVISTDYFKSVCASLRRFIGGRVRSFETLLERGRRESLLRLKDEALAMGADFVLNVRFETMTIARSNQGKGITGVEVLAYGTAVRTAD